MSPLFTNKYYELAMHLVGLDPNDEADFDDEEQVQQLLKDRFGIEIKNLEALVESMLPLIGIGQSELTGVKIKGLRIGNQWLCKIPLIHQAYPEDEENERPNC